MKGSLLSVLASAAWSSAQQMGTGTGMGGMTGMTMDDGVAARRNTSSSTACADVHFFVVRASTESPGQGVIGTLATMSSAMVPGSSVEAIDYPAVLNPYGPSSSNGTATLKARMMNYIDGCSRAKVVLMGYSQGAHVVGDVMCGGGDGKTLGPATPAIEKKYADKVVAVVQMGDPRFMTGKSWDVGTSKVNGLFPRTAMNSCDAFANKMKSYCDEGDPFCAGGKELAVHLGYTRKYNKVADEFVMERLMASGVAMGSMSGQMSAASQFSLDLNLVALLLAVVPFII